MSTRTKEIWDMSEMDDDGDDDGLDECTYCGDRYDPGCQGYNEMDENEEETGNCFCSPECEMNHYRDTNRTMLSAEIQKKVRKIGYDLFMLPNGSVEVVERDGSGVCVTCPGNVQTAIELTRDRDAFFALLHQLGSPVDDRREQLEEWKQDKAVAWAFKKLQNGEVLRMKGFIRLVADGVWGYGGDPIAVYLNDIDSPLGDEPFPSSQVIVL